CPSVHHHERGSPMKNRKREICTSGSVRDEDGQPPHLLGHRRQFLHLAACAAALPAVSRTTWAQTYPARPVRLVVPLAPGSATDIVASLGSVAIERLGQQFVIDNRPGDGGRTPVTRCLNIRSPAMPAAARAP